ncbi:MAG: TPM domain-containing protein, partial [Pyramidobacter sp.]|nr:TPM domain-containing protein [Pyramidobacter sp.]
MKKRFLSLTLALLTLLSLLTAFALPASAEEDAYLIDSADIISSSSEKSIDAQLRSVSEKYGCPVIIKTVKGESSSSYEKYAISLANQYDATYGKAIVLVQFPDIRKYQIEMRGNEYSMDTVEKATGMLQDAILEYLEDDDYIGAYKAFASKSDYILESLKSGGTLRDPYPWLRNIVIALIVALIVGAIYVGSLKKQLTSVALQRGAANYVKDGSMNV